MVLILCNQCERGTDGASALIRFDQSAPTDKCPNGGITVYTGLDRNGNNVLDSDEVTETTYVCNGISGSNSLIEYDIELQGENCTSGGYRITTGIDFNSDGELQSSEVQDTVYICSGNNALIRTEIEPKGQNCEAGGYKIYSGIDINGDGYLNDSEIQETNFICHGQPAKQLKIGYLNDPDLTYTKLNPYIEIKGEPYNIITYGLDIDKDGSNDFQFISYYEYSQTHYYSYSNIKSLNSNNYVSLIDTTTYPKIHSQGDIINNLNNWGSGEYMLASFRGYYFWSDTIPPQENYYGIWRGISNKYIAIRMDNERLYYGWIQISLDNLLGRIITLHEYAYK